MIRSEVPTLVIDKRYYFTDTLIIALVLISEFKGEHLVSLKDYALMLKQIVFIEQCFDHQFKQFLCNIYTQGKDYSYTQTAKTQSTSSDTKSQQDPFQQLLVQLEEWCKTYLTYNLYLTGQQVKLSDLYLAAPIR